MGEEQPVSPSTLKGEIMEDQLSTSVKGEERFETILGVLLEGGLSFPEVVKIIDYSAVLPSGAESERWVGILIDAKGDWKVVECYPSLPARIRLDGKQVV